MPKGTKGFVKGIPMTDEIKLKISSANKGIWIDFKCDYCEKDVSEKISHYKRKKRHFCSVKCYALFRREKLPMNEQNSYKGVRKDGDPKNIYSKNYAKRNPSIISRLKKLRYEREKGSEGSHSEEEWEALKKAYDYKCAICKKENKLERDHIIPISIGGNSFIENIQPLCKSCNSKKSNKYPYNPELLK